MSFVETLWKLQDPTPYFKYSIDIPRQLVYPGSTIKSYSSNKRSDVISMTFTKVTDANKVTTCSCAYSGSSLD